MSEEYKATLVFLVTLMGLLAILVFGTVAVFLRQDKRKRQHRERQEALHGPEPVCGCGEHFSFHDPRTGQCMKEKKVATKWKPDEYDDEGIPTKWETRVCGCQRYTGPQPMPELYAQPFSTSWSPPPPAAGEQCSFNADVAQDYRRQMRESLSEGEPDLRPGQHRLKKMMDDKPEGG